MTMNKKLCVLLFGVCLISISACGNKEAFSNLDNIPDFSYNEKTTTEADYAMNNTDEVSDKELEKDSDEEENNADASGDTKNEDANANEELVDGMRPEFKEAMDSYEAFYDEYCNVLKKYAKNPSDMQLLADYTKMLTKAAEMSEKFDAWEENEMNDTELKYYLGVVNRVTQKLVEVSE